MITLLAILNGMEIAVLVGILIFLFGAKKLPEIAKGLGQSIKEFRKAGAEIDKEN
jgi:sec-independent protein translocase protein TatA